ncbi:ISAs1 family transposase [Marinobacter gelidimuriae]|uniref:ISAs1 family transposase n=1 Tax=Marinobacter gelidimuriae TaxID=2739064 RepID=UPI00035C42F1|nr:ISAs1 family transposase [Marinobacter gelidimuriae]
MIARPDPNVGVVMSFRSEGDKAPAEPMIRHYISSAELSAKKLAEAARQHWYIENKLHWSLDVALRDDACKIHRGYAAENLARVRHIALNYLKGETNFKGGIRRKQKKAALDENYLAAILAVRNVSCVFPDRVSHQWPICNRSSTALGQRLIPTRSGIVVLFIF